MRPFDYTRPESVREALATLDQANDVRADNAQLLAGGTDLLTLMKHGISTPEHLIDIKRLNDLDATIDDSGNGVTIGALTTLAEIGDNLHLRASYPALTEAASLAATPQLRNMATIGGNLLQRPRCWYYRSQDVDCWLKGGDGCLAREGENQHHALFGDGPCYATHASDLATALLALNAEVHLRGPQGDRNVALDDFFTLPTEDHRVENALAPGEMIMSVTLPALSGSARSTYRKAMDRKVWAFALFGVGAQLEIEDQHITGARLVLGGVAPVPWRVRDAEEMMIGAAPGADLFARVARAALDGATPLAKNGYKIPMGTAMIQRALNDIAAPDSGA